MTRYRVILPQANLLASPHKTATCVSQVLYGEVVSLISDAHPWLHVTHLRDSYSGFIRLDSVIPLDEPEEHGYEATDWVQTRSTLLLTAPDIKSPVEHTLPFASCLQLEKLNHSSFSRTHDGYFVWTAHCLSTQDSHPLDPLFLAQSHFIGAPYVWGGRSSNGTDCSGLIQLLAQAQHLFLPRDSKDQESYLKQNIEFSQRQSGDIVFWPGHVGMLVNQTTLLHATAYSMSCIIEPLANVIQRAGEPTSVKRLFIPNLNTK